MDVKKAKAKKTRRLVKVRVDEISLVSTPAVADSRFLIAKRDEDEPMSTEAEKVVEEVAAELEPVETPAADPAPEKPREVEVVLVKAADSWIRAIKLLRGTAADMDPSGLEMLANVIRYTMYRYGEDESVRMALSKMDIEPDEFLEEHDDIEKALKVIGPSNFAKIEAAAGSIIEAATGIQSIAKSAKEIKKTAEGEPVEEPAAEPEPAVEQAVEPEPAAVPEPEPVQKTAPTPKHEEPEPDDILSVAEAILKDRRAKAASDIATKLVAGLERIANRLDDVEKRQTAFSQGLQLARGKV